jgi:hypothetical protein
MRRVFGSTLAVAAVILIPSANLFAQGETSKGVAGGGITAAGWTGQVDANEAKNGMTVNSAKLAKEADGLHVTTGPADRYWNPRTRRAGNYTVKATFKESKYMNLNDHPHPYGIGSPGMTWDTRGELPVLRRYGNGKFIMRGFGPAAFKANGGGEARVDPQGRWSRRAGDAGDCGVVKGDKVECAVNGAVVGTYDKAALVGAAAVDGRYLRHSLRSQHGSDRTGLTMTKN